MSKSHTSPRLDDHPGNVLVGPLADVMAFESWASDQPRLPIKLRRRCLSDRIEWYEGGSLARIKMAGGISAKLGGGIRGEILAFSDASRQRLLGRLASVNRDVVPADRLIMVTLTYPGNAWWAEHQGDSFDVYKRHLDVFSKRLCRAWGWWSAKSCRLDRHLKSGKHKVPFFWKIEAQRRGAPHFHLLLFASPEILASWSEFMSWVSRAWFEVVGSGEESHLLAGTRVERIRTWRGAMSYCAKYLGKSCCFVTPDGEPIKVGRYWGVRYPQAFGIELHSASLHDRESITVKRTLRRYVKAQQRSTGKRRVPSSLRYGLGGATVFVSSATIEKLIAFVQPWRSMVSPVPSWPVAAPVHIWRDWLKACETSPDPRGDYLTWISEAAAEASEYLN